MYKSISQSEVSSFTSLATTHWMRIHAGVFQHYIPTFNLIGAVVIAP